MKVLVYTFGDCFSPHLETQADLIQQHLDAGDDVIRLVCNSELPICLMNPHHRMLICTTCLARRAAVRRLIQPRVVERSFFNLHPRDRKILATFSFSGSTLAALTALTYESFDIGMAVASALIDDMRDPYPDLRQCSEQVRDWLGVSLAVYLSAKNTLEEETPDCVYVFNGRRTIYRAVLRACQAKGVDCYCHDGHMNLERHTLARNRLPHELAPYCADAEALWAGADHTVREKVGAQFFEDKVGEKSVWVFTQEQDRNLLPENWDPGRRNIAVFPSSEFEMAAISSECDYPFYEDQNDGICKIVATLEAIQAPIHLYIRMHPHLKGDRNPSIQRLLSIRSPKATVIPPESPVSTYELLRRCEKVLTFGSTVGIEAVYWDKPSILAGPSFYGSLGGTYNPANHEELIELLLAELPPKPKEAALKFGYHELQRGVAHVYCKREALWKARFKGQNVDDQIPWFWRVVLKLTRSRLYPFFDALWRIHRRYLRHRYGIRSSDGRAAVETASVGGLLERPNREAIVPLAGAAQVGRENVEVNP